MYPTATQSNRRTQRKAIACTRCTSTATSARMEATDSSVRSAEASGPAPAQEEAVTPLSEPRSGSGGSGRPQNGRDLGQLALLEHGAPEEREERTDQPRRSILTITGDPNARVRPLARAPPSRPRTSARAQRAMQGHGERRTGGGARWARSGARRRLLELLVREDREGPGSPSTACLAEQRARGRVHAARGRVVHHPRARPGGTARPPARATGAGAAAAGRRITTSTRGPARARAAGRPPQHTRPASASARTVAPQRPGSCRGWTP